MKIKKWVDKINMLEIGEGFETKKYIVRKKESSSCMGYLSCIGCYFNGIDCTDVKCDKSIIKIRRKYENNRRSR